MEEQIRTLDRIRADAQRDVESARVARFPERRRRDRRVAASDRGYLPERRRADRRG